MNITNIKKWLLDMIFPVKCMACKKDGFIVCKSCLKSVLFLEHQNFSDGLIACTEYYKNPLVRRMIFGLKYKFYTDIALVLSEIFKTYLVYLSQFNECFKNAVIVPVPLHTKRFKFRDFNQSKILSECLVRSIKNDLELSGFDLTVVDCLKRVSFSKSQAKSTKEERAENLRNSIVFNTDFSSTIKNRFVLVLDDVATTGSTINECAKVLKNAGAAKVFGFVLARA